MEGSFSDARTGPTLAAPDSTLGELRALGIARESS
jgi:hypothetical protein